MLSGGRRFELGSVVADRRIDSIAGYGGMGVVYRAWNLRLKRVEAVKVIAEEYVLDPSFRVRFERETEIAASIQHPHVVTLYDSGEGPSGELFIAMQYVEGTTLERLIRQQGRIHPRVAAELVAQVADALDSAHAQGLVHRDIKPANILIAGQEPEFHAYLTDFGLAKRVRSDSGLTTVGIVVGTVDFMPPEQARARAVDLRADVYALGATLFVALTGEVPFPGRTDALRVAAKINETPPPVTSLASDVPRAFDAVLARALATDPDQRYQTAGELGRAALEAAGSRTTGSRRGRGPRSGSPDPVVVGSLIDERYRIESEAGSGGMAVVYRATHLKLQKTVAIKVMSPQLTDDPEFQRRFEQEARSASEIDHENVVPVYDFGEDEHGLFMVMRFVATNLRDLLRERGPLEPARAVQVIEQVASALDSAHARGLLHRDIKPANILVEESTSRIYLADFGLVRSTADDVDVTRSRVMGTDWYMAPERRYREETKLGDIYSLGCVLWEMLAGAGKALPGRSALSPEATVPSALRAVVERAVSERPLDRYQSAGDMAQAARDALEQLPSESAPAWIPETPVFHEPLSRDLGARVLALCAEAEVATADPAAHEALAEIRRRLTEPLVLAVIGPGGAGKSTLVGALIGRSVTGDWTEALAGHPTRLAWGAPERVEVAFDTGERRTYELAVNGDQPPRALRGEAFAEADVYLSAPALEALTIVDSPARDAAGDGAGAGLESADALLFATTGEDPEADRRALSDFRGRLDDSAHASAVNAIAVLTKADRLAADAAVWEPARGRAHELAEALAPLVGAVVPVAGRIVQSVSSGAIEEADVERLARWAQLDPARRERLFYVEGAAGGDEAMRAAAEGRERLLELLGRYGVRLALELAGSGAQFNLATLSRHLRENTGIEELRKQIDGIQLRTDALKADAALIELESLSWRYGLRDLRDQIERVRLDAPVLELIRVFPRCASGEIELPGDMLGELEQLLTARTTAERVGLAPSAAPEDVRAAAAQRARRWRTWAGGGLASFQGQQVANKVDDFYTSIALAQ